MTAAVLPAPADTDSGGPDVHHLVCECDLNRALCGRDVTHDSWVDPDAPGLVCRLCYVRRGDPCVRCGWTPEEETM